MSIFLLPISITSDTLSILQPISLNFKTVNGDMFIFAKKIKFRHSQPLSVEVTLPFQKKAMLHI